MPPLLPLPPLHNVAAVHGSWVAPRAPRPAVRAGSRSSSSSSRAPPYPSPMHRQSTAMRRATLSVQGADSSGTPSPVLMTLLPCRARLATFSGRRRPLSRGCSGKRQGKRPGRNALPRSTAELPACRADAVRTHGIIRRTRARTQRRADAMDCSDPRKCERADVWTCGRMDTQTRGHVDRPADAWTCGRLVELYTVT